MWLAPSLALILDSLCCRSFSVLDDYVTGADVFAVHDIEVFSDEEFSLARPTASRLNVWCCQIADVSVVEPVYALAHRTRFVQELNGHCKGSKSLASRCRSYSMACCSSNDSFERGRSTIRWKLTRDMKSKTRSLASRLWKMPPIVQPRNLPSSPNVAVAMLLCFLAPDLAPRLSFYPTVLVQAHFLRLRLRLVDLPDSVP